MRAAKANSITAFRRKGSESMKSAARGDISAWLRGEGNSAGWEEQTGKECLLRIQYRGKGSHESDHTANKTTRRKEENNS